MNEHVFSYDMQTDKDANGVTVVSELYVFSIK